MNAQEARLRLAYIAGALTLIGLAFLVAAIVLGPFQHEWRRAFFALFFSYPIGSFGDRLITKAKGSQ